MKIINKLNPESRLSWSLQSGNAIVNNTPNFNNCQSQVFSKELHALSLTNRARLSFGISLHDKRDKDFKKTLEGNDYFRLIPDEYQIKAARSIFDQNNLIVSAPTGTGKTLIAEYAIRKALNGEKGVKKRIFYTSPLKALCNNQYDRFKHFFGEENVGINTGDRKINTHAPVVVMTTEVYRNMVSGLYTNGLVDASTVIFDEFHNMNNEERGGVWEESVMKTPTNLNMILLSATMGNVQDIQTWISSLNGAKKTDLVSVPSSDRYVPLRHFMIYESQKKQAGIDHLKLSRLTEQNINFINLVQSIKKNALSEVQKTDLKDFAQFLLDNKSVFEKESTRLRHRNNILDYCLTLVNSARTKTAKAKDAAIGVLERKKQRLDEFEAALGEIFVQSGGLSYDISRPAELLEKDKLIKKAASILDDISSGYGDISELKNAFTRSITLAKRETLDRQIELEKDDAQTAIDLLHDLFESQGDIAKARLVSEKQAIEKRNQIFNIINTETKNFILNLKPENLEKIYRSCILILANLSSANRMKAYSAIEGENNLKSVKPNILQNALVDYLGFDNEKAKRLPLVLASKEEQNLLIENPIPKSSHLPAHKVIEFLFKHQTSTDGDCFPMIYFIFSKADCNNNLKYFVKNKLSLVDDASKKAIAQKIQEFLAKNPYYKAQLEKSTDGAIDSNLKLYLEAMKLGIGIHHRGMLPPLKQLNEELFNDKLLKVVMATETIAAGLDFPAKTVVIDSLQQPYDNNSIISANKFHQMSGRAGRRGKDQIGNVIVVNNINNTRGLAYELINSPPDKIESKLRINYGMVLNSLNNNNLQKARDELSRSFKVFQLKDLSKEKPASQNKSHILEEIEEAHELLTYTWGLDKQKPKSRKAEEWLQEKINTYMSKLYENPYCETRLNASGIRMKTHLNKQRNILMRLQGALSEYECMHHRSIKQDELEPEKFERLQQNKQKLVGDLNNAINLLTNAIKTPEVRNLKKRTLSESGLLEDYLVKRRENLERLSENPLITPEKQNRYLEYQERVLENIKTKLELNVPDKNDNIRTSGEDLAKIGELQSHFTKCFRVLKNLYAKNTQGDSVKNIFSTAPFFTENDKGEIKLTDKGEIAARIQGVNQIIAAELIHGKEALFRELKPEEIVTVASCLVSNLEKLPECKLHSIPPQEQEFPDKLQSSVNKVEKRVEEIVKIQESFDIKGGKTIIPFDSKLANAFYALVTGNNFDFVFNACIKDKPRSYMEGDFAEHILRTVDLLMQLRESLSKDDIELKIKIHTAINLLNREPIAAILHPKERMDENKFDFSPKLDSSNARHPYRDSLKSEDIDATLDSCAIPKDKNIRTSYQSIIKTSPALLKDYAQTLYYLFSPEFKKLVNQDAKNRKTVLDLFRKDKLSVHDIAEKTGLTDKYVIYTISDYDINLNYTSDEAMVREIYNVKLRDGGFIFEEIAAKEFDNTIFEIGKKFLKKHNYKPDDTYMRRHVKILRGVNLYSGNSISPIGESDIMLYDTNLGKVL